jgi:hypothetical protein
MHLCLKFWRIDSNAYLLMEKTIYPSIEITSEIRTIAIELTSLITAVFCRQAFREVYRKLTEIINYHKVLSVVVCDTYLKS